MRLPRLGLVLTLAFAAQSATGQAQQQDAAYAEKIRAYTTDERFLCDLVDHLPTSETAPSPLEHFGIAANSRHYCPV